MKEWAEKRDPKVIQQYEEEFDVSGMVSVSIKASGKGQVLMEGMTLPSKSESTDYTGKFFAGNPILLTAVPTDGSVFTGWSDGETENPRLVNPVDGASYTAKFN